MAGWSSYSYQDYLNPPRPWSFVFQVRAGGTHRIFRQASYARTQRAIASLALSPSVTGFTLELPTAYTPQRDFYHANASDQISAWAFARDDLMYLEWGRLGYDPTEPEAHFRQILAREADTDALWPAVQAASDIVPWITTGRTCGPDQRHVAPELELGGDVARWAKLAVGPDSVPQCDAATSFDTFAIASPDDAAADLVAGAPTSRIRPAEIAGQLLADADLADQATAGAETGTLARDVAHECAALARLGRYFAHKLLGATALAVHARTGNAAWLASARAETGAAGDAWRSLVAQTAYIRPFEEHLRMAPLGYDPFHWSRELAGLDADTAALDAVAATVTAAPPAFTGALPDPGVWLTAGRAPAPTLAALSIDPADPTAPVWTVRAQFGTRIARSVRVLWKPFDSQTDWTAVDAVQDSDGTYVAIIAGGGAGALFAVEVSTASGAWRLPDPTAGMPYVSLPP